MWHINFRHSLVLGFGWFWPIPGSHIQPNSVTSIQRTRMKVTGTESQVESGRLDREIAFFMGLVEVKI